jgi:hypothetical protein
LDIKGNKNDDKLIIFESALYMRVLLFLGSVGIGLASVWVLTVGLSFESKYALYYIGAALLGIPYGIITFFMAFPAFTKRGRVLFTITPGDRGQIISGNKAVYLEDIKEIGIVHEFILSRPRSIFFSDLLIKTTQGKVIKIQTYNLLIDEVLKYYVENHMFNRMSLEGQQNWRKKFNKATIA